eukprot:Rhum_TRINITY_DN14745_c1_g7::Rhum_TRINITY_DN14745_c1_g7_i1::g.112858::m.112858
MLHRALVVLSAALLAAGEDYTPTPVGTVECSTHLTEAACVGKMEKDSTLACTWHTGADRCVNAFFLWHSTVSDAIEAWKIAVIVISVVIVVAIIACVVACCCCCNRQKEAVVVVHPNQQQQVLPAGQTPGYAYPQAEPQQGVPIEMGNNPKA